VDLVEAHKNTLPELVWLNDGAASFATTGQPLGTSNTEAVETGDFDGDGDVDFIAVNYNDVTNTLWLNDVDHSNSNPSAPTLSAEPDTEVLSGKTTVVLEWLGGADAETSDADLLTYDLRVGTSSGACDVYCGYFPSVGSTPWLGNKAGNAGATTSHTLKLATGTYYWAVRTVDTTYKSSDWTSEDSFIVSRQQIQPQEGIDLSDGWNLVGISEQNIYFEESWVFSTGTYEIIGFDADKVQYDEKDDRETLIGTGYWIYSDSNRGIQTELRGDGYIGSIYTTPTLSDGWNLIASPFTDVIEWSADNMSLQNCGSATLPSIYHYENGSGYATIEPGGGWFEPWKGYWIKVSGTTCTLRIENPNP